MWLPHALILAAALNFDLATAWYREVHNQIGLVAESLLHPRTRHLTSTILGSRYNGSIGRGAGWADTIRPDPSSFSFNWHYIDMHEHPPTSCSNDWTGLCEDDNCVTAQIVNQTDILRSCLSNIFRTTTTRDSSQYNEVDCQQALLWVVHFIGDVAQPLHTSGTKMGGNGQSVRFGGIHTDLHSVWDRWIVYSGAQSLGGFSDTELHPYFARIRQRVVDDDFEEGSRSEWLLCDLKVDADVCPWRWAEDSHGLVCSAVYSRQMSASTDLFVNGYAKDMLPVVDLQLAKAAWRTAAWLDGLVDGLHETTRPDRLLLQT